jgi:energy-coupling factor transporter ATP-binding protein EcfA2
VADQRQDSRGRDVASVRFESVSFAYGDVSVFRDLNLEVRSGECFGVAGHNSAGKSTLLLLAGGALKPTAGRVHRDAGAGGVFYLPQSPERLFFAETVLEEVSFGLERRGLSRADARERADAALREVSLDPREFGARSPFQLSFGEMRRVAFAIAASLEPGVLLLDEPASCLDRAGREVLDALLGRRLRANGTVVIASHEEGHLERVCDRVVSIARGCIR